MELRRSKVDFVRCGPDRRLGGSSRKDISHLATSDRAFGNQNELHISVAVAVLSVSILRNRDSNIVSLCDASGSSSPQYRSISMTINTELFHCGGRICLNSGVRFAASSSNALRVLRLNINQLPYCRCRYLV